MTATNHTEHYGDHLRVCGADTGERKQMAKLLGSSPRVRSRLLKARQAAATERIISACAEQTRISLGRTSRYRDHLRVCGADHASIPKPELDAGSSPRVRSRRTETVVLGPTGGIISACAEQTL